MLLASCKPKNYDVQVCSSSYNGEVVVTMHCPRIGVADINEVSYDGFSLEEVEKEIYDEIRSASYDGDYDVYVILQFKDNHGNYYDGNRVKVSTLNGADVKEYASYSYFNGKAQLHMAFPWNHRY